jgi:hypothetical protein
MAILEQETLPTIVQEDMKIKVLVQRFQIYQSISMIWGGLKVLAMVIGRVSSQGKQ